MGSSNGAERRPKIPAGLPCGCAAIGSKSRANKDSMTIEDGSRVCRHGTTWALQWVKAGEVRPRRGRPQKNLRKVQQ